MQPLDIDEGVGAVRADIVGDGGDAIDRRDRVVGNVAGEDRRIEGVVIVSELANGHELAGIPDPVQHVLQQLRRHHAVEGGDFRAGSIDVGTHADAHVQPTVAVDQIVAATTLEQVTAGAAEHDVAGGKAGGREARLGQECTQPVDQGDIGQCAPRGAAMVEDRDRVYVVAAKDVGKARAGKALDLGKAVEDRCRGSSHGLDDAGIGRRRLAMRLGQRGQRQVDRDALPVVSVGDPVEAGHAVHLVLGIAADEDVVAALADELVEAAATDEDVVADDVVGQKGREVIARGAVLGALLDPVVAFVAGRRQAGLGAVDEVVTTSTEGGRDVLHGDDKVLAVTAENEVPGAAHHHVAGVDDVVAGAALEAVVAAEILDDVVSVTAQDRVVAVAAFQSVVAGVAVEGVVAVAGDDDVVARRATENDMVLAGVLEVVGVRARRRRIVTDDERKDFDAVDHDAARRVGAAIGTKPCMLPGRVDFEREGRRREDRVRQMRRVAVEHHELGEGVVLEFGGEIHAGRARQVVEAVAVLQRFKLGLEDEIEGRAEHAAKRHLLFRKAADPEIDVVEPAKRAAGKLAGRVQEVETVCGRINAIQHQQGRGRTLVGQRRRARDRLMCAIGRDEIDKRFRVLEMTGEIGPTGIGLELAVAGHREEFGPRVVERGNAGVTAAGDIQRRQVERQSEQVVAQCFGDELVDFVANLAGDAAHDRAGRLFWRKPACGIGKRIEEGRDEAELRVASDGIEVRVKAVDRLDQHRMAEAVNRMRELGEDSRIDRRIVAVGRQEFIDLRLDRASELFEHQMLILHLRAELRRLEQAFAIPIECVDLCLRQRKCRVGCKRGVEPLVEEGDIARRQRNVLGLLHQPIVLRMEHGVHGGKADILVHAAVASDVVGVEKLVVVLAGRNRTGVDDVVGIGSLARWIGTVRDVVQEGMSGAGSTCETDRRGRITLGEGVVLHHHQGEAIGPLDEIAIGIDGQDRHVADVGIGKINAEDVAGLCLDHGPGRHATNWHIVTGAEQAISAEIAVGDQFTGRHRIVIGIQFIGTQEDLMRGI
ncbi:hypothetical protein LPJGGPFB_06589 [Ensifer adhaerens]|nr:hypothetical protein [Ensifer adhaerens]